MLNLKDVAQGLWGEGDDCIGNPSAIIIHSYGPLSRLKLPRVSEAAVSRAAHLAKRFRKSIIFFGNTDYFWRDSASQEDILKRSILASRGIEQERIVTAGDVHSTVSEVALLRQVLEERKLLGAEIVVFAHWTHTRSVHRIWRELSPSSMVHMKSVYEDWESENPVFFHRSWRRSVVVNVVRHVLFTIFGTRIGTFRQPCKRE